MLAKEISPFIRRGFILKKTPYNKLVKCADCRLFYILEGSGEVIVENKTHTVEKDSLYLWKSGTEYCWNFSKKEKVSLAILNFDYTQNHSRRKTRFNLIPQADFEHGKILATENFEDITVLNNPICMKNMHLFKNDVLGIIEECENKKIFSEEAACSSLHSLIIKIAQQTVSLDFKGLNSKIRPVLEYIESNYDKEITNISLGKMVNYHPHYINLLMKEYSGTTLHSYLTEYRMKEALKLIINTDLSIEEISAKTGYKNPAHFCTCFRKKFGSSPSVYRKNARMI